MQEQNYYPINTQPYGFGGFNPTDRNPQDFIHPKRPLLDRLFVNFGIVAYAIDDHILIVDLSHWNGNIDVALLLASGVEAVIIKCSEAAENTYYEYKDSKFEIFWRQLLDAGLTVMVYHFFRGEKGNAEFSWFMKCADAFLNDQRVNGNTAVWLDCEWKPSSMARYTYTNRAFAFCDMVKGTGFRQGIYSSPGLVPTLFDPAVTRWGEVSGWNAHWTSAAKDTLPSGWFEAMRRIWQVGIYPTHSWVPQVNGAGTVDVNYGFWNSVSHLREWLGFTVSSPSASPSASASPSPSASSSFSPSAPPLPDCCEEHELRIATLEAGQQVLTEVQENHALKIAEQQREINSLITSVQSLSERVDAHGNQIFTNQNDIESLRSRVNGINLRLLKIEEEHQRVKDAYCGDE
jgi:GH25 family lysozyme M1 (1,4-beta-N-acetylmuramidase)